MTIFERISTLLSANINHLLDKAENPEAMIKQIIRDMEESIIELRRETGKSIAQQKQLEKKTDFAKGQSSDLETRASAALGEGNEALAKQYIAKKLEVDNSLSMLEAELKNTIALVNKLKEDLVKLEDQVQMARRKKEELIRRKRTAQAQLKIHQAMGKSNAVLNNFNNAVSSFDQNARSLDSYQEKIMEMEAEAEATEELLKMEQQDQDDAKLKKAQTDKAVAEELKRLKDKQKKKK